VRFDPARSSNLCTHGTSLRENREILDPPAASDGAVGRTGKAEGHKPVMHGSRKSGGPIVPTRSANTASNLVESAEGRCPAEGNAGEQNASRTQSRIHDVPSELDRVRRRARQEKEAKFTALLHHVSVERLRKAYFELKRNAAPGVDGVTWRQYGEHLGDNLAALHARLHRGAYRAKPSRRVYIPKATGGLRPLGIASLEDKVVQRAVVEVMNAIYEQDFLGFSYGFRRGRSQHDALDALAVALGTKRVNWVLDADVRGFYDAIDHEWLLRFLEHRIADRRLLRLIQKWLKAGVMEEGRRLATRLGAPQGATVSPLLANIYLHYAYDLWAHQWRKRHARGDVIIVRYGDDAVVGFEHEEDARSFLVALRERLGRFKLELHPDKTKLVRFRGFRPGRAGASARGRGPRSFCFLGFEHWWGKKWNGRYDVIRRTEPRRMRATLKAVKRQLVRRKHDPVPEQGKWLAQMLRGYFAYYAVPTNARTLGRFRTEIIRLWRRQLRQRSQRTVLNWRRMNRLSLRWLPPARAQHPWPGKRFRAKTRGGSPVH
jgi:group II intron reverse transcriptase/maturase